MSQSIKKFSNLKSNEDFKKIGEETAPLERLASIFIKL